MIITYDRHAVRRMLLRQIPLQIVEKVATVGVPVKETRRMVLMRGQWGKKAIHVLKSKQTHTVHTVYVADEWQSSITVTRMRQVVPEKRQLHAGEAKEPGESATNGRRKDRRIRKGTS
ncbi:MAG: hypothetical protein OWT28_03135 [Firmicutes bacterium]|nr:hypothetical protein [Bacillota bacterium]